MRRKRDDEQTPPEKPSGPRVPGDAASELGSPEGMPDAVRRKVSPLKAEDRDAKAVAEADAKADEGAPVRVEEKPKSFPREDAILEAAGKARDFEERHRKHVFESFNAPAVAPPRPVAEPVPSDGFGGLL